MVYLNLTRDVGACVARRGAHTQNAHVAELEVDEMARRALRAEEEARTLREQLRTAEATIRSLRQARLSSPPYASNRVFPVSQYLLERAQREGLALGGHLAFTCGNEVRSRRHSSRLDTNDLNRVSG